MKKKLQDERLIKTARYLSTTICVQWGNQYAATVETRFKEISLVSAANPFRLRRQRSLRNRGNLARRIRISQVVRVSTVQPRRNGVCVRDGGSQWRDRKQKQVELVERILVESMGIASGSSKQIDDESLSRFGDVKSLSLSLCLNRNRQ